MRPPARMLAVVSLAAALGGPAAAQPTSTQAIAHGYVTTMFVDRDVAGARAKYVAAGFIEHNPEISSRPGGDAAFFAARRRRDPAHYWPVSQWKETVDHLVVQGDLFAVHHHVFVGPQDHGRVFLDLYRVSGGKIVEHWDVIEPVPEHSANSNTMW